jgi:hypothetical protein
MIYFQLTTLAIIIFAFFVSSTRTLYYYDNDDLMEKRREDKIGKLYLGFNMNEEGDKRKYLLLIHMMLRIVLVAIPALFEDQKT